MSSASDVLIAALGWAKKKLRRVERALDQLKLELVARRKIVTLDDLKREMETAGYDCPVITAEWSELPPGTPIVEERFIEYDGTEEQCDECGAIIPHEAGGSLVNEHHMSSCSLYEDHIDSNSGV